MRPARTLLVISISFAGLSLSSCNTKPPIKALTNDSILLSITGETTVGFWNVEIYQDDYDCFGTTPPQTMPFSLNRKPYITYNFNFLHSGGGGGGLSSVSCVGTYTFATDAAREYRLHVAYAQGYCGGVVEKKDGTGQWVKVESIKREWQRPNVDNAGPWCKSDARFRGSSNLATPRG